MDERPYRVMMGEICCSNCDHILTSRTGGGMGDPFGWKFKWNQKQMRKMKLKNIEETN